MSASPVIRAGFQPAWPCGALLAGIALIATTAQEPWLVVLPQFVWGVLSSGDFGSVAFTAWLLAFWRGLAGQPPPDGLLPWSERSGGPLPGSVIWPVFVALLPFGAMLFLGAIISGTRLAEAWAAAWLPLLLVGVAALRPAARRLTGWRRSLAGNPRQLLAAALVPSALFAAVGLVFFGYARPLEAASVALIGVVVAMLLLRGPQPTWLLIRAANGLGVSWFGGLTLWLVGGVVLFAGMGLSGLQGFVAQTIADGAWSGPMVAAMALAGLLVIGRWLQPATLVLLGLPVLLPGLGAAGYGSDWCVTFVALGAGLSAGLRAAVQAAQWRTARPLLIPALVALAMAGWPEVVMGPARSLRFW